VQGSHEVSFLFRIRRIHDDVSSTNQRSLARVQELLRTQFPGVAPELIDALPQSLRDPLEHKLRTVVLIAEGQQRKLRGFAVLMHAPDLAFCYLDFISARPGELGRGVGGALYERVRDECRVLGAKGLFFECLPDEPADVSDPEVLTQNAARLRFYERYGARPIANTEYNAPVRPRDTDLPYLVFDDLGMGRPLQRKEGRAIVRAILERKYAWLCPPEYVDKVVRSFRDNPVKLRPFRYQKRPARKPAAALLPDDERILLVVSAQRDAPLARDRGFAEAPVQTEAIRRELAPLQIFQPARPKSFPDALLHAVHDPKMLTYLRRVCGTVRPGETFYPYVFPERTQSLPPTDLAVRAGYYCLDSLTPLSRTAWFEGRRAVDCALTGAQALLEGRTFAYALARPPGHHASAQRFGGSCYLNSAAVAAAFLARQGKVALLDLDYHHGSGHQSIFWKRGDVLTVSIHAHPRNAYPYFTGFAHERGEGEGASSNVNMPLPERVDGALYARYLHKAIALIRRFEARFLVVSLGFDVGKGDPTGSWDLVADDFEANGACVARAGIPTLFVQEGGYPTREIARHARRFFVGLVQPERPGLVIAQRPRER
jgi:acetoin utilization deacetylase AcuC-like enzyme/GNAT superfamily N-acetyltransferase